ncbi:NYN domain-containing protein [Pelagibacterium sp.]|uniref:NYN domain-containing protein n=1 Tax=Pelagibacterium sp. TaxID=1967288 RepID=UPI003BA99A44
MRKAVILIDGGHLRVLARRDGHAYDPDFIERFARECVSEDESLMRVLYYDCAPYSGTVKLPVSGEERLFESNDGWLRDLASRDLFAVRRGVLKFRGFVPRRIPIASSRLADEDFKPSFEQKGVDMRIGLDIATFSEKALVDRIILVSGDTDCVPAMKHARISGLQLVLVELPNHRLASELVWHSDIRRAVKWPN